jgi:hypothetical protein
MQNRPMSIDTIEQKLSDLESRMAAVEAITGQNKRKGNWQEIVGWEEDDEAFREAVRLGAEWRAKANEEGK